MKYEYILVETWELEYELTRRKHHKYILYECP